MEKRISILPQVILPGHIVTVTLYGIFDAGNEDDEEDYMIEEGDARTALGSVTLHSHNIARLCRNNTYHHFDITVPSVATPEKQDETQDKTIEGQKESENKGKADATTPNEVSNVKGKVHAMRLGMLFSLCNPKVAEIQSSMQKENVELLRSIVNEWRKISVPPARITRRVIREIFGTYASYNSEKKTNCYQNRKLTKKPCHKRKCWPN